MSIKVSVIIPVYNPGKYIQPCIDSLLRQTLPADEFEVLFVDDGSTDDSPAELDALAEKHPHFRVIHIPNSGWPGKPRNIGVGEAKGEYVQFVDQDDYLASDALRRLYEMGHRNGSDIVIGKVASNFRGVPHGVFKADREKCTIHDAPLYDSLTPHKMFRAEFLRENKIAYPEGKRRLEDQLYMMEAYFPAKVVSILGSYTCYYYSKRDDGKNAGSTRIVPSGYYGNLREVLDVVMANTEPGEFRDLLLRRFYRVEMLGRLSEPNVLKYDEAYLGEMLEAVRPLAEEFMGEGVRDGLGALTRVRSTLLRRDDSEGLLRFARFGLSVKGATRLETAEWRSDGKLAVTVSARLVHGDDAEPVRLLRRDGRFYLHPELVQDVLEAGELVDVTDEMDQFKAEMSLRNRETAVEWPCAAEFTSHVEDLGDGACEVVLRGSGVVSPQGVKGRGPVSKGFWDIWISVRGLGLVRKARLGADRVTGVETDLRPASAPLSTHSASRGNLMRSGGGATRSSRVSCSSWTAPGPPVLRTGSVPCAPGPGCWRPSASRTTSRCSPRRWPTCFTMAPPHPYGRAVHDPDKRVPWTWRADRRHKPPISRGRGERAPAAPVVGSADWA
ncbi:glycosyltransferase family 2 protein [Streptomyces sp. NPDC002172]